MEKSKLAGIAVDVDRDDGTGSRRDCRLDRSWIKVQRVWIDICKDGCRAFVDRAVRRGDERVGRRDHLVARTDSRRDTEEMQACRTARDGGRVGRLDSLREQLLETIDRRAKREPPRPQHLERELLLALVEPGCGEPDLANGRGHAPADALARAESTTSSHEPQRSSIPLTVARYAF